MAGIFYIRRHETLYGHLPPITHPANLVHHSTHPGPDPVYRFHAGVAEELYRHPRVATSALDTYGAGRYIDCTLADIHGDRMTLDFNKAYNPYCAYTTGYNCPVPPKDNDLPVAIQAGEKNYGKRVH